MAFQVSPGVNISEIDLTTIVPAVATSLGAIAGCYEWGPARKVILVDTPKNYRRIFGDPKNWNYTQWFSGANFLGYSSGLQVVRVVGDNAKNAVGALLTDGLTEGQVAAGEGLTGVTNRLFENEDYFENTYNGIFARYPGEKGNSLKVAIFPGPSLGPTGATGSFENWEYSSYFGYDGEGAPEHTDNIVALAGATSNDQIHLLVIDEDGKFSGARNTILERYSNLSVLPEARREDGTVLFYKSYINSRSQYIYVGGPDIPSNAKFDFTQQTGIPIADITNYVVDWGTGGTDGTKYYAANGVDFSLTGGVGQTVGTENTNYTDKLVSQVPASDPKGYNLFEDIESYDVNLLIAGGVSDQTSVENLKNLVTARKDAVAFFSAVNKNEFDSEANKVINCQTMKSRVGSSSYCVIDSGYKYQYDPYNDLYRWVPLNADVAGICARTEYNSDAWVSPAGYTKGQVRDVVKLAFNPAKTYRDVIYPDGINPIINSPGEGTILLGDKTALSKPSAFDRINVRRLFIVLEKAIATASKFSLFEFNDQITRSRFVSLVTPFLSDVKSRRGIIDFKVVCDSSNNTPERIDRNEFWADIYIKPNRSINYIQLNFIATRTDSSFNEFGA